MPDTPDRVPFDLVLVSDTHGRVDPLFGEVEDARAIVHAGDFDNAAAFDAVAAIGPELLAVAGNCDWGGYAVALPTVLKTEVEGLRIVVTHILAGRRPPRDLRDIPRDLREVLQDYNPHLVVFGHTHRRDIRDLGTWQLINPGSVHSSRDGQPRGWIRLTVTPDPAAPRGFRFDARAQTVG